MAETTAPTGDRRKLAVAVTAGVAALAALVWLITGQTVAGFTAQTRNDDNTFQAGSIEITDSDAGEALFEIPDLLPGQSHTDDITVINGDDAPLKVKVYSSGVTVTALDENGDPQPVDSGLDDNLEVTVSLVTQDGDGDDVLTEVFDGTLAEFAEDHTEWSDGASNAAGGDALAASPDPLDKSSVTYRITVKLSDFAGLDEEDVQPGETATANFIWEGRA